MFILFAFLIDSTNFEGPGTNFGGPDMGLFTYYVIIFLKSQTELCDRWTGQLVVAEGHNIIKIT